jgi:hypothetical protein
MRKRRFAITLAAWLCVLMAMFVGESVLKADEPTSGGMKLRTAAFMRAKLASSQKVIEGLVTNNFALIKNAAEEMKQMSDATQWPTAQDKSYQHYQEAFRRECDQLARFAANKNLAAAHYTYLQLTTTCINCHDYVRRTFRIDDSNPKGPVMLIPNEWEGSGEQRKKVPTKEARHTSKSDPPSCFVTP